MGTFTTKLKLGGEAFAVDGDLDPFFKKVTVGQICVIETMPNYLGNEEKCYVEKYMCLETGVGSGRVWEYGKNIFATEKDAKAGVIAHQQAVYKERAKRDAWQAKEAEQKRLNDLCTLERLKKQYETA